MVKKKDPLWIDLLQEANPRNNRSINVCVIGICDDAEKILKRPPVASDMDADLAELLVRKWVKAIQHRSIVENRVMRLKKLCDVICSRFNRKDLQVDWASFPMSKRDYSKVMAFEIATPTNEPKMSKRELDAGMNADAFNSPLASVMQEYRRERLTGKSENSGRLMDVAIRNFEKFLCRKAILGDLNKDTIIEYLAFLLSRGNAARASIRTHQERLYALWRFAVQKHWLLEGPTVAIVSVPERVPDAWTDVEMVQLLHAAQTMPDCMKSGVPWKVFWPTLVYFLYDTAERVGAAMMVRHDDIANGWVTVRAEYRKGQTRDKRFKLRQCTIDSIAELRKCQGTGVELVFDFPYTYTYLWGLFKTVLERAGLPDSRRFKFHKIRRSCASRFEAAGGDATKLLDHRHRGTTQKYLDPAMTQEKQLADLVAGIGEVKARTEGDLLNKLRQMLGGA